MGTPATTESEHLQQAEIDLLAIRGRVIKVIQQAATWGGLFAVVAVVGSTVAVGRWSQAWTVIATYAGLMILFWFPGTGVEFRGMLLVFVCFLSGATQLLIDATHGSGYQMLVGSVVLGGLFHDRRLAIVCSTMIVMVVFVITGLYGLRILKSPDPAVGGILWWMSWSLSFTVIAAALVGATQYIVGQLVRSLAETRKASAAKNEFLTMVSHELRTPLTPVLLLLSSMENARDIPEEHRTHIAVAREQIELESRLVADLLDLSRVVSRRLQLQRAPCDVHRVVRAVLEATAGQLDQKQLALKQSLDAGDCIVDGDGHRLHQVFHNILDNAIKFTPEGGVITVRSTNERGDRGEWLLITVQDTGIGMKESLLESGFIMFEQQDRSITRQFGGMGIGLTICKGILDEHHGEIVAASDGPNLGSVFTVRLPVLANGNS